MSEENPAEEIHAESMSEVEEAAPPTEEQVLDSGFPTLEQMAALLPQYEFHDVLGVGGMGAVYLARQMALDRRVAIKLLPQSASLNEDDAARFIKEARSMAKLTHANIAAVYEFGQTSQGHLYLVMEHIQGLDLHRLIHRGEVTPPRIRALVPQLCDALQYAHDHQIIHRDIKPANILITPDWQAKIVDFGLAGDGAVAADDLEYGTPDYVAPERLQTGAAVDHRADIYALGVVIHEMFTKTTPQAAGSSAFHGMPEAFRNVVARCTAPDPAKRFHQCREIKSFLAVADMSKPSAALPPSDLSASPAPAFSMPPGVKKPVKPMDADMEEGGGAGKYLWAAAALVLLTAGYWFMQNKPVNVAPTEAPKSAVPAAPEKIEVKAEPKVEAPKTAEPAPKVEEPKMAAEPAKAPEMPASVPAVITPKVVQNVSSGPFKPQPGEFGIIKRLSGHSGSVYSCEILEDQRRIVSGGSDGLIRVWDAGTGALIKGIPGPVSHFSGFDCESSGTRMLVYSMTTDETALLDVEKGTVSALIKVPNDALQKAVWSPDGKGAYLVTRHVDGGVYFWDPAKQGVLESLANWNRGAFEVLPFTDDSGARQLLVSGAVLQDRGRKDATGAAMLDSISYHAALFSADDRQLVRMLPDYSEFHPYLRISGDGKRVSGDTSTFGIFETSTMRRLRTITPPSGAYAQTSAWVDGSRLLLVAWNNGDLALHEAETGQELAKIALGFRAGSISVSQDLTWAAVAGYTLSSYSPSNPLDVLVVRLPDLSKIGSEEGRVAAAASQLTQLDKIDPALAALRDSAATAPDAITTDGLLVAAVRDLTLKYGLALKRAALKASPKEQLAMNAEADAIAKGTAVPEAGTDASTAGEHKRFRGIYRQQLVALETKRKQGAETQRKSIEGGVLALAKKRRESGDAAGAARCEALLASYDKMSPFAEVIATAFNRAAASAPPTPVASSANPRAPTSSPTPMASGSGIKLTRQGKAGELIKIERSTKNGYTSDSRSRVGSVPPNLGPVCQVTCNNFHGLVILSDGSLKGWGSWSGSTAYITPPEVNDAVMIDTTLNESAAVLGNNTVLMWNENGSKQTWTPPGGVEIKSLASQESWGFFVITADGRIHAISSLSIVADGTPPPTTTDVVSVSGSGLATWGVFAAKKDGSIIHWGKENLYIGQQHLNVKDALAVAVANSFLCVLHKDGALDGWGQTENNQRFRSRKYPGATRILPDPAGRIFLVAKPGAEWSVALNPALPEYAEEQRLGTMEGKLKGCTSVALSGLFVFAVKPEP